MAKFGFSSSVKDKNDYLDVRWDAPGVVPLREQGEAVDEGDDDVLDVDHRVQLPARRQEVVQGRQVHLVGENLTKEKGPFEWIGGFLPIKF